MKLNEVFSPLYEKGDTDAGYAPLENSQFREIILQHRDAIAKVHSSDNLILRGMKDTGLIILGDGAKMNRKSKNTSNYYTLVLDNDVRWKDYPKRSQSFICATGTYSEMYGNLYVVVPLENQPIGICPTKDFWFSFEKFSPDVINIGIQKIEDETKILIPDDNFEAFKAGMKEAGRELVKMKKTLEAAIDDIESEYFSLARMILKGFKKQGFEIGMDLYDWYAGLFDPETNIFDVTNDVTKLPHTREVWVSGKVLFIDYHKYWHTATQIIRKVQ